MTALTEYEGRPIEEWITRSLPDADRDDVFVFLMGPYRLLDPAYLYPDDDYPLPPDPLAPRRNGAAPDAIEATLRTICDRVSAETGTTAFIASDIEIPTRREAERQALEEPGMPVIDQSVAFAKASAGNAFVFTKAGLTTGAGAEAGAIPEHFRLRDADLRLRDPRTFCIFAEAEKASGESGTVYEPRFSSASIDEMDDAYDLRFRYFVDRAELVERLIDFVESYVVPLASQP
ncbi:DUF7509 family protein [Halopiger xanaduensis]|uniref:DUF7509 domain-containing protein n=1 Tax=Halopiger xanaduensis (strain DSM 18323 / JCM 14033 / SH-6) TaxID=797210 RepID=F8D844_HALXS|nr:hypothetical protein [Halopiger xanaduensis]AEH37936.1 hypothetical protein Halxa_3324 [Halopiger xanaduensis SH-6]